MIKDTPFFVSVVSLKGEGRDYKFFVHVFGLEVLLDAGRLAHLILPSKADFDKLSSPRHLGNSEGSGIITKSR